MAATGGLGAGDGGAERPLAPPAGPDGSAGPEAAPRPQFGSYLEFLLVSIGLAVGLGNLIVFPGRVYEFGGGAFLIPYVIALFTFGCPLFTLELKLGQYFRKGPFHGFQHIHKRFWCVGFASVLMAAFMGIFYNTVMAWSLVYLCYSFADPLPWAEDPISFFYDDVLQSSPSIAEMSGFAWYVLLANAVSWLFVGFALSKGVLSSGKVAYVTATLPYVCIVALLVRGALLPGAGAGVRAYLRVDFAKLAEFDTWARAFNQIFFSLSVALGALVTFGSYRPKSEDYVRDGILVPVINCLTSFTAGFFVFAMLGYISEQKGVEIGELEFSGFALAFITYTEGLAMFPRGVSQFFSVLFFATIYLLGIDSQIGIMESLLTYIKDSLEEAGRRVNEPLVVTLTCCALFVCSLPLCTDAGYYWTTLFWDYGCYVSLFTVGGMTVVAAGWVLGYAWLDAASREMRGKGIPLALVVCWKYVDPALCAALMVVSIWGLVPYPDTLGFHGEGTGAFPPAAQAFSLFINFLPTAIVAFGCAFPARWLPEWFVGKRRGAAAAPPGVVVADVVAGEVELSLPSSASLAGAAGRRLKSLGERL